MLVDANILLYSVEGDNRHHEAAKDWLTGVLNGVRRVGMPWIVLTAFIRIATNPRAVPKPISPAEAWAKIEDWLACDTVWIPGPTERHAEVLGSLVTEYELRGNLVTDAQLTALAIEHGLTVCSVDTDFARFKEIRWVNPLA